MSPWLHQVGAVADNNIIGTFTLFVFNDHHENHKSYVYKFATYLYRYSICKKSKCAQSESAPRAESSAWPLEAAVAERAPGKSELQRHLTFNSRSRLSSPHIVQCELGDAVK